MKRYRPTRQVYQPSSAFAGFRFPPEVILIVWVPKMSSNAV
jgi:hypothetical protein